MVSKAYALITAARNEEAYIARTLESVAAQTVPPAVWVIVSDGSTDRTDEIVNDYSSRFEFIRLLRLPAGGARVFSSQAHACNSGYESIRTAKFDFAGFLDADISLAPTYYGRLLEKFHANPRLGIGGGQIVEAAGERYAPRAGNSPDEVAGAVQFLRRECLEEIGGLIPLRWGGHDAVANVMARRNGWEVRTFPDLDAIHHRPTGTAGATIRQARFREGMQDYFMGYHLLFEIGKCAKRISERPYVAGSLFRLSGYLWPAVRRQQRALPSEFVRYLKQQQLRRLLQSVLGV
jgi:biofilm PGA synthesis N-glycosyltransferase PgaC